MDSKRKSKLVVSDGDYTGNTPGSGLPFERLRDPASGWDTEATPVPMLEQQCYTLLGTGWAAGVAGSGTAAASVPSTSSSKLAGIVCCGTGEVNRKGKRKLTSDDDNANKHSIGRRRQLSNKPSSSMAGASAWQAAQKNNNDTSLPSAATHHQVESGCSFVMANTSMAVEVEEHRGRSDWPITVQRVYSEQKEPKGSGVKISTGIGVLLQTLRGNGDLPSNPYEQVQLRTTEQLRTDTGTPKAQTSIADIPTAILELILERLGATDLRSAINSSFLFARVAMAPCHCRAFRPGGIFMGAIIKRTNSHLLVPQKRMQKSHFKSGIVLMQRFFEIATASRGFVRAADARGGQILMLKDKKGKSLSILRPFHSRQVISLPPSQSVALDEDLLCGTLIPVSNDRMNVVLMFRGLGRQLKVSMFDSRTGLWDHKHLLSPFQLSPISLLRNVAVYANKKIYLLDSALKKVLVFSPLDNHLDSIAFPIQEKKMFRQKNILARTRDGELCWATIERMIVKVSIYTSDCWKRRWSWCIPNKFYCCHILGQAQGSGLLILGYSGELCTLDIEMGEFADLHDFKSSADYLGFDLEHSMIDHM